MGKGVAVAQEAAAVVWEQGHLPDLESTQHSLLGNAGVARQVVRRKILQFLVYCPFRQMKSFLIR